ncbi:MAG: hypothetical protein LBE44_12220 [Microbacterium hominis]|uniref:hypothetical protein n=1 Tax=Microbacterium aurum TaxID=36805 RepID=UPI00248F17B7|nr:hypothetical protein [Microbacterium aurum]MBZ6372628.1 hypothetical protein [Microbacterium hominis]
MLAVTGLGVAFAWFVATSAGAATTGPTTGPVSPTDRTDPTGPTDPTDPGTPGTPGTTGGGSIVGTAASVGNVTALAETGGALSTVPLWAGLFVLAAGVMLIARSTTRALARGRTT